MKHNPFEVSSSYQDESGIRNWVARTIHSQQSGSSVQKKLPRLPLNRWVGWQFAVVCGCCWTAFALICNIGLLAWASDQSKSDTRNYLLHQGDCSQIRTIDLWSHLGINILSTIILGFSNYGMQVLVAPTRKNVDDAHHQGRILDIGISGFGNWRFLCWKRKVMYLTLVITSLPLHLLYNSVIFSTTSAVNYEAFLVSQDFLQEGSQFNTSQSTWWNGTLSQDDFASLQQQAIDGSLISMTNSECISSFGQNFVTDYSSVILISNLTSSPENTLLQTYWHRSEEEMIDLGWMCNDPQDIYVRSCTDDPSLPDNWIFTFQNSTEFGQPNAANHTVQVERCLAKPITPNCTIQLIPELLYTVVACNICKVFVFIYLLFFRFEPLITIGDAIASFLDEPDPTTKGLGAMSARDVRGEWSKQKSLQWLERGQDNVWHPRERRFFAGAAKSRWAITMASCSLYWITGLVILYIGSKGSQVASFQQQWSAGLGVPIPTTMATLTHNLDWATMLILNIMVANAPQLLLSIVYLSYNGLFTCMFLSAEWASYARERKGLRVTRPEGYQRESYWLSLPYKVSMPLIMASSLLHWMLSQSLFLVQISIIDATGTPDQSISLNAIGWSTLALTILLAIGGILIITIVGFGFFTYTPGIPIVSSNSRAISAACHPPPGRVRESVQPLQYGVVADIGCKSFHVSFGSGDVRPLLTGQHYE